MYRHITTDNKDKKRESKRNGIKDDLVKDYDAVIRESALLTTASRLLIWFSS